MNSIHICFWETVGTAAGIAVGSAPVRGAANERAARRRFHRETVPPAGVKLRVYRVEQRPA